MEKRSFLILKALLVLVVITESAAIPWKPKHIPRVPVTGEEKNLEQSPEIGKPGRGRYDSSEVEYVSNPRGQTPDYDYNQPMNPDENHEDESRDRIKPEIIPEYEDETIDKGDGPSKPGDEDIFEPFDGEDAGKVEDDEDEESKPSTDEYDESKPSTDEDDGLKPSTDEPDELKPSTDEPDEKIPEESEEVTPEEEEDKHDDNDKTPDDDDEDDDDDDNRDEKGSEHSFGGSIFDTPFFNLNKVRNYFNQMERALRQVFHQVVDEARLLNGTYANTTEEEIDVGGKKYVVQKSVIKGADNHSSIYVETLSTKPKSGHGKYKNEK